MATETLTLETIDGVILTADLAIPPAPWAAAVVAHPHPQYGGDRHNIVVTALFDALAAAGVAVMRFDFRGAGDSDGRFDGGQGERLDVAAAVEAVAPFAFDGPLVLCGYSFGAAVALDVTDPRLAAWFAVAPPLGLLGSGLAGRDHRPKLVLAPEHDQFTPPPAMRAATEGWVATTVEPVAMADHFLAGRTGVVAERAVAFARSLA